MIWCTNNSSSAVRARKPLLLSQHRTQLCSNKLSYLSVFIKGLVLPVRSVLRIPLNKHLRCPLKPLAVPSNPGPFVLRDANSLTPLRTPWTAQPGQSQRPISLRLDTSLCQPRARSDIVRPTLQSWPRHELQRQLRGAVPQPRSVGSAKALIHEQCGMSDWYQGDTTSNVQENTIGASATAAVRPQREVWPCVHPSFALSVVGPSV